MSTTETLAEPSSLGKLQRLTTPELKRVGPYQHGDSLAISKVMRSIVRLAVPERSWQGKDRASSVREFWYNPVKPIAQRAFPDYKDSDRITAGFNEYMAGKLSKYLSERVLDDTDPVTYRTLNIYDESRPRDVRTEGAESQKVVFVEKDAAYRKVRPLADTYELTVASGGGQSATAAIEAIADDLDGVHDAYDLFVLADFDPSGFGICESFHDRAADLGMPIRSVNRLGVDPSIVDPETVREQRFELPNDDLGWEKALDGRYGLEIEAVSGGPGGGQRLREMIVSALREHIRSEQRRSQEYDEAVQTTFNEGVRRFVSNRLDDVQSELVEQAASEARDIYSGQEGVRTLGDKRVGAIWTDFEEIDDRETDEVPILPAPPSEGALHKAAIEGEPYTIETDAPASALCERLQDELNFEIEVSS
jgi:hypothetical protein